MKRLTLLLFFCAAPALNAQDAQPDARKTLYDFLVARAANHFEARKKEVAALKTPEQIKQRQDRLRSEFLRSLGSFPAKCPLNPTIAGTIRGDGFRVEKVIFDSRPQHQVTANLYLPDGKGPFPGVIVPCGHSVNGKAAEAYQRVCMLLARNGIAALCYDPIGQGERFQMLDAKGNPISKNGVSEHIQIGIGAWLVGQSTATYRIWDGIRALDYLESRPDIDGKRLGCTGNSGGGTLTAYLMVLDDRIVAAAPSCYITSLERLLTTIGPQDAEQNIVGQIAFGMNHADYLTMRAPRPTLMCVATKDFFDIDGAWASFREAKLLYGKLGHGERVSLFEYPDGHGFSKPRREAAMRWMRRWLLDKNDAPVEDDFKHFKDEDLQCTRSGQVLTDFKGVSAFGLSIRECEKFAEARGRFVKLPREKQMDVIADALRMMPNNVRPSSARTAEFITPPGRDHVTFDHDVYTTWRELAAIKDRFTIAIPEFIPDTTQPRSALSKKYQAAIEFESLGIGGFGKNARPASYSPEFKNAMISLMLDRPLLGLRVDQLRWWLWHEQRGDKRFHLVGEGMTGLIALHVAALDPRVEEVTMEGSIVSWEDVVRTPDSVGQIQNVVPGVLTRYDLPELIASLAPRKVNIVNPVDARLQPLSQKAVDDLLAVARQAYAAQNAADKLVLKGLASGGR